jgi:molecular chaperone IbpA
MNQLVSFTPLLRQTVGFDRFNDLFETLLSEGDRFDSYPPYNIEKSGEDEYRITMAVAGFGEKDLNIVLEDGTLTVSGQITDKSEEEGKTYLHRGIATRSFSRAFRLADHILVEDAEIKDGLLTIALRREVPEEMKPRMIPVRSSKGLLGGKKKAE